MNTTMKNTYRTVLAGAASAAIVGTLTYAAMAPQPQAVDEAPKPANVPTWTQATADEFPGCVPMARWNAQHEVVAEPLDRIPGSLIVVRQNGQTVRMDTEAAWSRLEDMGGTKTPADDVWVLGACQAPVH